MSNKVHKKRVIVYIDGYNLYYGMRAASGNKYKWLDLQSLSQDLLQPDMTLVAVKYFTALTNKDETYKQRQGVYLKALQAHCDTIKIIRGHFVSKTKQCKQCGTSYEHHEEKQTDVNIACELLHDAHLDNYDCCYIISGDSDLVPPLKILQQHYPNKHAIVAHPPKRKSNQLCQTAHSSFAISEQKLRQNQLPPSVINKKGKTLTKPPTWS